MDVRAHRDDERDASPAVGSLQQTRDLARVGPRDRRRNRAGPDGRRHPRHAQAGQRTHDGSRFTHRVTISGPLSPLFARVIGGTIAVGLPTAMQQLSRLAETTTNAAT